MTLQEVREFLDACHEVSYIIAAFPELPKGLSPRHIKALQAIHDLQTKQELPIGANPPDEKAAGLSEKTGAAASSDDTKAADPADKTDSANTSGKTAAADSPDESLSCSPCCRDNPRVKVSDVSDFLGGTRPSVTKLISELEAHGALVKTRDTDDKRIIWLRLTPTGEQYYSFYGLQYHEWLGRVLSEIPQEDFETTIRTISQVHEILCENRPPKP